MKHKLSYSLLLSLVVLFSFNLAFAQGNVTIVGPAPAAPDGLHPNTVYCYDVVLDDMTGITAFTIPVSVSGAGFLSGSITVMPGTVAGVTWNVVGDQVLLGYVGASAGMGPHTLATICITTTGACGEDVVIAAGNLGPSRFSPGSDNGRLFGMAPPMQDFAGTFTGMTSTLYDGTPVCGNNPDENLVCGGAVSKQIQATEPIGLQLTYTLIAGQGAVTPTGLYTYDPDDAACDHQFQVTIRVTNPCGNHVDCSFMVNYDQLPPIVTCPANQTVHWAAGEQTYCAQAQDQDACPNPPGQLTWSITSAVPAPTNGITIDQQGCMKFTPDCLDIALSPITVTVKVSDGCEYDECQYTIEVTNDMPWITCPDDTVWQCCLGPLTVNPAVFGDDTDPTTVSIFQVLKEGDPDFVATGMSIDQNGVLVWDPGCDLDLEGVFKVILEVDDGCWQEYCWFYITMYGPYEISILGGSCTEVMPGYRATVTVSIDHGHFPIGGFDLLISYDNGGGINFLHATAIGDLADYWEYFTYRFSWLDNCGGGCPSGYIRLVGIYDLPNGDTPAGINLEGDFVELTFQTTQDLEFIGQCFWLDWAWMDCGDNTLSSITGDTLFIAMDIDTGGPLHEYVDDEWCMDPDKGVVPIPCLILNRGCICLVPPEDDRGDINLNGIANEIADAVLYANAFIYGWEVMGYPDDQYWPNRQLASDVNNDGVPMTVADLVYLIRIITGDANPFPESGEGGRVVPFANAADVSYITGEDMLVKSHSTVSVGAAAFVFRHTGVEVGVPVLSEEASGMTIRSADRDGELRVLVYSMENNSIDAGSYDLFTVPTTGEGSIELIEVQFSDAKGNMLAVNTAKVSPPSAFALLQNYPNPFNAGTMIRFALPEASDWSLRIYNVAGQLVNEFKGQAEAGLVSVHWDAANAGSGIYFYKLDAGKFTDTKKMILMK
jgi:hypothetical protein